MNELILFLVGAFIFGVSRYAFLANRQNSRFYIPKPLSYYPEYDQDEFDLELIRLINEYRVSLNIGELAENEHLSDVSYSHSMYMEQRGVVSHDFFSSREAEFPNRILGEVVTFNHNEPQSVLIAWKGSPTHNQTILNIEYKFIGVSYAIDQNGDKYVCALLLN